jgi:ATP-dependent Lhr-like helicase
VASGDVRRWHGRWIDASRVAEYAHVATDPGPILARHVRHAGPVTAASMAARYRLDVEVVEACLAATGEDLVCGRFTPETAPAWASRGAVAQMHRQAILALRRQVRPVAVAAYGHFLAEWHGLHATGATARVLDTEVDRLRRAVQQLRGLVLPVTTWRRDVIAPRVGCLAPNDPDILDRPGADVAWVVAPVEAPGGTGRVRAMLSFRGEVGLFLDGDLDDARVSALSASARDALDALREEGALLVSELAATTGLDMQTARHAVVELLRAGLVTHDSPGALVALAEGWLLPSSDRVPTVGHAVSPSSHGPGEAMPRRGRAEMARIRRRARDVVASAAPITRGGAALPSLASRVWAGRWSLVHRPSFLGRFPDPDDRRRRQARQLLARWGVVTRASVARDAEDLDWDALEPVFAALEVRGEVLRGYFVDGFPGVQYALPEAVERLRTVAASRALARSGTASSAEAREGLIVIASLDPAFWPIGDVGGAARYNGLERDVEVASGTATSGDGDEAGQPDAEGGGLRSARGAHLAVAIWWGDAVATMSADSDGRATLVTLPDHPQAGAAAAALARWWAMRLPGAWIRLIVTRWNGHLTALMRRAALSPGGGTAASTADGDRPDGAVIEPFGFVRDVSGYAWVGERRAATG